MIAEVPLSPENLRRRGNPGELLPTPRRWIPAAGQSRIRVLRMKVKSHWFGKRDKRQLTAANRLAGGSAFVYKAHFSEHG
jgi:hypothetical protein